MVSANLIILKIILFTVLTNGQNNNPFFICQRRDDRTESYDIILDRNDGMIVANCTNVTTIAKIIDRLYESALGTTLTIHFNSSVLHRVPRLRNVSDLDLSNNRLMEIDLREYRQLRDLNLTSNRIRSLAGVILNADVTLNSLDLSRNRLLAFEHLRLPSVRKLYLRSNNIFELPSDITLPEPLEELDLTRNEIENVTDVVLRSETLRVLNLSINLIDAFGYATIERLPNLESLNLECNKILELEPGTFSKNAKLTELNLRDNNLSTIKKGVFENLKNLQSLDISKNDLLRLTPEILQSLHSLTDFSVSENRKLCQNACKRNLEFLLVLGGRLRTLKMTDLRMRKFPITLTTSVRHLDLSENKLNAVQSGNLENFPHLRILILTSNEIESFETQVFSSMEYLAILRLDRNRLKKIPPALPSSLVELRLDRNNVARLDKASFSGLANLEVLNLGSNSIESVEPGSMSPLKNLRTLDVSDNPILKLSTDAWEGLNSLRTLVASDLRRIRINATDVRYFPTSEMRNLRTLNLTRSPRLVRSFLADLPLLATTKQLETLDLSYTNLTSIPAQLRNYLPRLKLLRLRGNAINCSASWFGSRDYDYRDLPVDRTNYRLKVRLVRDSSGVDDAFGDPRDCAGSNFALRKISSDQFWFNVNRAATSKPTASPTLTTIRRFRPSETTTHPTPSNSSSPSMENQKKPSAYTAATATTSRYRVRQSARKTLNARSLRTAQFSRQNDAANRMNSARLSTAAVSPTTEIKLPSASVVSSTKAAGITTSLPVASPSTSIARFEPATLNVTFFNDTPSPAPARLTPAMRHYSLTKSSSVSPATGETISSAVSPPRRSRWNTTTDRHSTSITLIPFSTSGATPVVVRTYENNSHASANSSAEGHYEPLVWNRTNDYPSFFDWFPGLNDSSAMDADLAERSIKAQQDTDIQYTTHPGLVIFSAVTCFLLVIFVSLIAPPYVQKYRWRRKRYKMSQFDNECRRSIEISSISAFVETETPLE